MKYIISCLMIFISKSGFCDSINDKKMERWISSGLFFHPNSAKNKDAVGITLGLSHQVYFTSDNNLANSFLLFNEVILGKSNIACISNQENCDKYQVNLSSTICNSYDDFRFCASVISFNIFLNRNLWKHTFGAIAVYPLLLNSSFRMEYVFISQKYKIYIEYSPIKKIDLHIENETFSNELRLGYSLLTGF